MEKIVSTLPTSMVVSECTAKSDFLSHCAHNQWESDANFSNASLLDSEIGSDLKRLLELQNL